MTQEIDKMVAELNSKADYVATFQKPTSVETTFVFSARKAADTIATLAKRLGGSGGRDPAVCGRGYAVR